MDKALLETLVKRAGLQKALAEFPEDVAAAAAQAENISGLIKPPADPRSEPWPPMKAGDSL